jgi:hypothetical protein
MADRSPQTFTETVLQPTYHAASSGGGDRVRPGNILHIKNANAAPVTVTFVTPGTIDTDLAVADRTRGPIANGADGFLVVPRDQAYRDADGMVQVTWSVNASVTFAVLSAR